MKKILSFVFLFSLLLNINGQNFDVNDGSLKVGAANFISSPYVTNQFTKIIEVNKTNTVNVPKIAYSTNYFNVTNIVNITNSAPVTNFTEITIEAESAIVTSPLIKTSTYIYQNSDFSSGVLGGKVSYTFNILQAGNYYFKAFVNAPTEANNSFYFAIDRQPTIYDIWDITPSAGFKTVNVSLRGNGAFNNNQFNPAVFNLQPGQHTINLIGREANVQLDKIYINKQ